MKPVCLIIAWIALLPPISRSDEPARDRDPLVLVGELLPRLLGEDLGRVAAFRFEDGWKQVPMQIDERKFVDFGVARGRGPFGHGTIAYADPFTYSGADEDPRFDADDELVLMIGDAGERAPVAAALPEGTLLIGATEVSIIDPLDERDRYVYLFRTDGSLDPAAGQDRVRYTFDLLAGEYLSDYDNRQGPNPEESEVVTEHYRVHFPDRWVRDEINVFSGEASGVDILDRHKNMFALGVCARTEDTFSLGGGGFFANIDGPIRGIRSYLGANSGTFTQRDHMFYPQREDVVFQLRVHPIASLVGAFDYSAEATGMTYHNDLNPAGVLVDGNQDDVALGQIEWEMITGAQGSLIMVHEIETDIDPFTYTSVYTDDIAPERTQCTGDPFEYATSGIFRNLPIPNTDPRQDPLFHLTFRRIIYYEGPDQTAQTALARWAQVRQPVSTTRLIYPRRLGDFNGDCFIDLEDYSMLWGCISGPDRCAADSCGVFDFDTDCTVDLRDFVTFTTRMTPDGEPPPGCK